MYRTSFKSSGKKRTLSRDGLNRDSRFEASIADSLLKQKERGEIRDYESQFKLEIQCYRADGLPAFTICHKVDFRIWHTDNSYELIEAKGVEYPDYVWRRKFIEHIWLPEHPDHIYTVIRQKGFMKV